MRPNTVKAKLDAGELVFGTMIFELSDVSAYGTDCVT